MLKLITRWPNPTVCNFIWVCHIDIKRLVCKVPEPYWNNVAFHCVISWLDWIFLSQQSWVVICRNRHMGYIDKGDRMANSYSINRSTWKWQRNSSSICLTWPFWIATFFFSSLGGKKISHRDFQNTLLWNLLAQAGHERNVQRPIGRPPAAVTQVLRLEECDRKHWPIPSATRRRCRACSAKGVTRNVSMICEKCDVALCCDTTCFWD